MNEKTHRKSIAALLIERETLKMERQELLKEIAEAEAETAQARDALRGPK